MQQAGPPLEERHNLFLDIPLHLLPNDGGTLLEELLPKDDGAPQPLVFRSCCCAGRGVTISGQSQYDE